MKVSWKDFTLWLLLNQNPPHSLPLLQSARSGLLGHARESIHKDDDERLKADKLHFSTTNPQKQSQKCQQKPIHTHKSTNVIVACRLKCHLYFTCVVSRASLLGPILASWNTMERIIVLV